MKTKQNMKHVPEQMLSIKKTKHAAGADAN
jgi:hypothetical protein